MISVASEAMSYFHTQCKFQRSKGERGIVERNDIALRTADGVNYGIVISYVICNIKLFCNNL